MEVGYLNLNAVYPTEEHSLIQRLSLSEYNETGALEARQASSSRVGLDAALGLRVGSNLAVGLGVTHLRPRIRVDGTASVPHPLFHDRHRESELRAGDFDRTELGIHLHAAWTIPLASRLDMVLSAGPSLFNVELDRVDPTVTLREAAPYNEVQVDFGRESVKKRVLGASVGIDLTYHFLRRIDPGAMFWSAGIGVFARWATGTSPLPEFGPDETLDVGGLRAGAGLRFRF